MKEGLQSSVDGDESCSELTTSDSVMKETETVLKRQACNSYLTQFLHRERDGEIIDRLTQQLKNIHNVFLVRYRIILYVYLSAYFVVVGGSPHRYAA